jgi:hypothetical protein
MQAAMAIHLAINAEYGGSPPPLRGSPHHARRMCLNLREKLAELPRDEFLPSLQ